METQEYRVLSASGTFDAPWDALEPSSQCLGWVGMGQGPVPSVGAGMAGAVGMSRLPEGVVQEF